MSILRGMADHRTGFVQAFSIADTVRCMPLYALGELVPRIASDAYVHPDAVVIGAVTIGSQSSIWPGAVLRGDDGEIWIGKGSSVQDNSVLHTTPHVPTVVGDGCVIGHIVHLEGCTIEDQAMVANGAIVLHRSVVRTGAIVAANAVVLSDVDVPTGALAVGAPAVIKPGRARLDDITRSAANYVERARRFRTELRRIDATSSEM
jgi:carbonic anhydrase/acetyltransferase-like protein (isoleucine patch superfamily)